MKTGIHSSTGSSCEGSTSASIDIGRDALETYLENADTGTPPPGAAGYKYQDVPLGAVKDPGEWGINPDIDKDGNGDQVTAYDANGDDVTDGLFFELASGVRVINEALDWNQDGHVEGARLLALDGDGELMLNRVDVDANGDGEYDAHAQSQFYPDGSVERTIVGARPDQCASSGTDEVDGSVADSGGTTTPDPSLQEMASGELAALPAPAMGLEGGTQAPSLMASEPPPAQLDAPPARPTRQEATDTLKEKFAKIDQGDGWGKSNGNGAIERDELESAAKSDDKELAAAAKAFLDHGDAFEALADLDGDAGSLSMGDVSGDDAKAREAAEDAKIKDLVEKMRADEAAVRLRDAFDKVKDPASGYISRESLDKAAQNKDLPPELRAACSRVASDRDLFKRLDNGADVSNKSDSLIAIQDLNAETTDTPGERAADFFLPGFGLGKLGFW